jgi:hypothetical protein
MAQLLAQLQASSTIHNDNVIAARDHSARMNVEYRAAHASSAAQAAATEAARGPFYRLPLRYAVRRDGGRPRSPRR